MLDFRKTLIYCRESRDENYLNYERIETQRDMLLEFCERRGLTNIVDIILDDDISGTNFKRFSGIIERVKRGEIEVIVFKDDSRLGRNLRESLNFVDTLEEYGVELIFENEDYNEDFFPLKAWFNEQRAKEDSLKIRRVMRHKMETGELLVKPIYGYARGQDGGMIVDDETKAVVERIFSMFLSGLGSREIAAKLNQDGVPTPSQVKQQQIVCSNWNSQHIYRILKNDAYTGKMTYRKRQTKNFKNKTIVSNDPEKWIIVENHHEPIIEQSVFDKAQSVRAYHTRTCYNKQNRPFSGMLQCGRCGSGLVLKYRRGRNDNYICSKNHREGAIKDHIRENYGCRTHIISEDYLYSVTLKYARQLLASEKVDVSRIIKQTSSDDEILKRIAELKRNLAEKKETIRKIYEDKLSGLIAESLFQEKYKEYSDKVVKIEEQILPLEQQLTLRNIITEDEVKEMIDNISEHTIAKMQLKKLFDKIIVYLPGEITLEDKEELGASDETYQYIFNNGGLVFIENIKKH